ncbi:MAG: dephospho-CoA kinase [Bacteroidales bacterium]|jgi:dephospho-CoA kinase
MKTVGLTGGIGSGKSVIAKIFMNLGTPVFDADTEGGKILDEDLQVRQQMMEWFGADIYSKGKPDRQKIAGIVFNDPQALQRLNSLIHPAVMNRFLAWRLENQSSPYVIHEAAILIETGLFRHMDYIILVTAPEEIRIQRVKHRDRIDEEAVRRRMQNQWSDEQKCPLASFIIDNSGESALLPRVLEIHKKLIG